MALLPGAELDPLGMRVLWPPILQDRLENCFVVHSHTERQGKDRVIYLDFIAGFWRKKGVLVSVACLREILASVACLWVGGAGERRAAFDLPSFGSKYLACRSLVLQVILF